MAAFREAVQSHYAPDIPPTVLTIFRELEWEWMARLEVSLDNILHTEQQYRFLAPILPDKPYRIITALKAFKETEQKQWKVCICKLHSEMICQKNLVALSDTTFFIRNKK